MQSAFGVTHLVSKEMGYSPMGPRKKVPNARVAELKAGYRLRTARNAGKLVKLGAKAVR